jgi:hypothetical protein
MWDLSPDRFRNIVGMECVIIILENTVILARRIAVIVRGWNQGVGIASVKNGKIVSRAPMIAEFVPQKITVVMLPVQGWKRVRRVPRTVGIVRRHRPTAGMVRVMAMRRVVPAPKIAVPVRHLILSVEMESVMGPKVVPTVLPIVLIRVRAQMGKCTMIQTCV